MSNLKMYQKSPRRVIKHRKATPKIVQHYGNPDNPEQCFVRLFKLYNSLCPTNRPDNAFYLSLLSNTYVLVLTCSSWTQQVEKCSSRHVQASRYSIPGYHTNHSLRATAATRLYQLEWMSSNCSEHYLELSGSRLTWCYMYLLGDVSC